jgi:ZIP family zinc transporter
MEQAVVGDLLEAVPWAAAVGGSLVVGALVAAFTEMHARITAAVTVFGGGALLAAVAFDVMPSADEHAGLWWTSAGVVAGMGIFVVADWLVERSKGSDAGEGEVARGEAIAVGLFVDGVPESAALGLSIVEGDAALALLAGIVISNLSEGYGAGQPIVAGGRSRGFELALLGAIALALAVATAAGSLLPADTPGRLVGTGEAVAAGAIIATVAAAIVPDAYGKVGRLAPVVLVLGFVTGYLLS